jgi:hypothetical protein
VNSGDLNIDLLENTNSTLDLKELLAMYNIISVINEATRVTCTSSKIIDRVIISDNLSQFGT